MVKVIVLNIKIIVRCLIYVNVNMFKIIVCKCLVDRVYLRGWDMIWV